MVYIRDMEENDHEGKGYVHYRSWVETYTGLMDERYLAKHTLERCVQIAKKHPEHTIIALDENTVVGFAAYNPSSDNQEDTGEVYAIYVLKAYQKRGIGKALMNECIRRLSGYQFVTVWVLSSNQPSIDWYQRYGFVMDGKTKRVNAMDDYFLEESRLTYTVPEKSVSR